MLTRCGGIEPGTFRSPGVPLLVILPLTTLLWWWWWWWFSSAGERVLASGSVQLPRFTLLESGSLLISPSHLSDAGSYTCMASNSRGIDEAAADLVVWGEEARCVVCCVARTFQDMW